MAYVMIQDCTQRKTSWYRPFEEYVSSEESALSALQKIIEGNALRTFLQPLVDFQKGEIIGYEALSRGIPPLESPGVLFETAKNWSLHRQLDRVCCAQAIRSVGSRKNFGKKRLFLNLNPSSFCDALLRKILLPEQVEKYGLSPCQIVLELTEGERAEDYGNVCGAAEEYRNMGYSIALDDLGAGYSGIRTISLCAPEYIKLDISMVRNISEDPCRQKLLGGIRELADTLGAKVIAEGVETREELETLASLGFRYAQGYFFEKPLPLEQMDFRKTAENLREIPKTLGPFLEDDLETVASLLEKDLLAEEGTLDVEGAGRIFCKHKEADHLVIVKEGRPTGLLTRNEYSLCTGGAFGYHLYQKHPVEEISNAAFLTVPSSCPVTEAARKAMERDRKDLYDPLVVVDGSGSFLGTVTMKRIIQRASTLEVALARSCNPLSGLPGNSRIEGWIAGARYSGEKASLLYVDLDRFKEYNDRYGFIQGDRMISLTASVLRKSLAFLPWGSRLGHVGGDDFVLVCGGNVTDQALERLCTLFDEEKKNLFEERDLLQRGYVAKTRSGERAFVPLVTLSCAVVDMGHDEEILSGERLSQAAAILKGKVKERTAREGRSLWLRGESLKEILREEMSI